MRNVGTEVLVIGGGSTGAGVALDAVLRGFKTILVEKGDLTHGTTGRFHGLLHSGARYAVKDVDVAHQCMSENQIVRRILPQAVEDTGGLFILLPQDDATYVDTWLHGCQQAGIPIEEMSIQEALREESLLNAAARRVFRVPDASVDSFMAVRAMAHTIRARGGAVWTRHRVDSLELEGGRVLGAYVTNQTSGDELHIRAEVVVNATGIWAGSVAALAGCDVNITLNKGSQIAYASRHVNSVISRLAMPSDGDILVPVGTVSVIGTTSVLVDDPDQYPIERWEIEKMTRRAAELVPQLAYARALRAWAGVRPLYNRAKSDDSDDGRHTSRLHSVIDHARRDSVSRFITVVGGKFTTYRRMAEDTVNLLGEKLSRSQRCVTADTPIYDERHDKKVFALGDRFSALDRDVLRDDALICECEVVTRAQLEEALQQQPSNVLSDLRRDLRLGMGPCQGTYCGTRAASILREVRDLPIEEANAALLDLLQARWKGIRPVAWGHSLRQTALTLRLYRNVLAADRLPRSGQTEPYPGELTS